MNDCTTTLDPGIGSLFQAPRYLSGESEKSFKNKTTRGGWGETGRLSHFSRRHRPLWQVARVLFSLCSFNTSPLYYPRAWHRLGIGYSRIWFWTKLKFLYPGRGIQSLYMWNIKLAVSRLDTNAPSKELDAIICGVLSRKWNFWKIKGTCAQENGLSIALHWSWLKSHDPYRGKSADKRARPLAWQRQARASAWIWLVLTVRALFLLCDVIQNKVIRKENFSWLDVFFGRPELFEQVKCLNKLIKRWKWDRCIAYTSQRKEKERMSEGWCFFFLTNRWNFVRNFH